MNVKESDRSRLIHNYLTDRDYQRRWERISEDVRVTYFTNGPKSLILTETASRDVNKGKGLQWNSWDLFVQASASNDIAHTLEALDAYTEA